ncbi:hypothetical protein [Streptomyces sp. NPDC015131]|uniref:DUF6197 family protein n=1 Tax=Streptomyces sp. NPDC015131 TaxID=3364941 RepID=UPI0036FD3BE1
MPDVNKADVYRHAATVIVRDGKHEGGLTPAHRSGASLTLFEKALKDTSLPVCALGACARAEWELYGTLPEDAYDYSFEVDGAGFGFSAAIFNVNDSEDNPTTAEDIALLLKQRAEEVENG